VARIAKKRVRIDPPFVVGEPSPFTLYAVFARINRDAIPPGKRNTVCR